MSSIASIPTAQGNRSSKSTRSTRQLASWESLRARKVLNNITIERLDGRCKNRPFEQEQAEDLRSSLMDYDQPAIIRFGLLSQGLRSDELHFRFGALRLIEVSSQR